VDSSEVAIEITHVCVSAVKSYLLNRLCVCLYKISGSKHPFVPQMSSKCFPNFSVEKAKEVFLR
jgi:hypothetical protein